MNIKTDDKLKRKNLIILFSLSALVYGLLCALVSFLAIPFAAAYFAALFAFSYPKKYGAVLYAVISVFICTVSVFRGEIALFSALLSVLLGISIALAYVFGRSKPEAVSVTVFLTVIASVIFIYFVGALLSGSFQFEAVRAFYSDFCWEIKNAFLTSVKDVYVSRGIFTPEELNAVIAELDDYFANLVLLLPSVLVIFAFIITGVAFKLFSLSVYKYSKNKSRILTWRFTTTSVFVFFYLILAVVNVFTSEISIFTVAAANLYSIFNFIYAYIGYSFVLAILSQRMRPALARLIIIAAFLLLTSFAIQMLAICGAVFTLAANKARRNFTTREKGGDNESENDNEKQ